MASLNTTTSPTSSSTEKGNNSKPSTWMGSISGKQTSSGRIEDLEAAGSFDSDYNSSHANDHGATSPTGLDSMPKQQPPPQRTRVYSEDDDEIRIAKAMALAMQNNPNMTPDEMKQLQNQLISKTGGDNDIQSMNAPVSNGAGTGGVPDLFATVGASMANLQKDIEKKTKNVPIVKNMEKMKKQFQENITKMTGGAVSAEGEAGEVAAGDTTTATKEQQSQSTTAHASKSATAAGKNKESASSSSQATGVVAVTTTLPTKTKRKDVVNPKPPPHTNSASTTPKSLLELPDINNNTRNSTANQQPQNVKRTTSLSDSSADMKAVDGSTGGTLTPSPSASTRTSSQPPTLVSEATPPFISTSTKATSSLSPSSVLPSPSVTTRTTTPLGTSSPPATATTTTTSAPTADLILPDDMVNRQIRLSATVWKRRSGFGKLSVKHGWERRRVVLVGSKVVYYKSLKDDDDNNMDELDDSKPDLLSSSTPSEGAAEADHKKASSTAAAWLEQAAKNIEKNIEKTKADTLAFIKTESDPNSPRGILDLVKERASVAAATGHSGAPTPFAISIKVKSETKWKFCFDSRPEQMEWLAALTDVVVLSSVDAYNAALVAAADPTHQSNEPFQTTPTLSEPSAISPPHSPKGAAPFVKGGHRLWMVQPYIIKSEDFVEPSTDIMTSSSNDATALEEELDETEDEDEEIEEVLVTDESPSTTVSPSFTFKSSSGVPSIFSSQPLTLRGTKIYIMVAILNAALLYSNAPSTDIDTFWYLITFVNFAGWFLLSEESATTTGAPLSQSNTSKTGNSSQRKAAGKKTMSSKRTITTTGTGSIRDKTKSDKGKVPTKPAFKPIAGTTTIRLNKETDEAKNSEGHIFAGYRQPSAGDVFEVRSHGYLTTKKKIPAPGELYELLSVDIFESGNRYPDMARRVQLPKVTFDDAEDFVKTWHAPDIFVISVSLPTDPPKMGRSNDNGGGYTITMYFGMKKDVRDILKRVTDPNYDPSQEVKAENVQQSKVNATKLLNEWCRRAPTDQKFQTRFKLIVNAQNLKEIGVPSWITKYNAKPMLIKRPGQTGFLYSHPDLNAMEFDVSLHPFPYLAKQGICYLKENAFKKILACFGFLIEGRSDDELPECMIGQMQLCYPDPAHAIQGEDFFAGTSPSSLK